MKRAVGAGAARPDIAKGGQGQSGAMAEDA
jgi:hypothetical protein